MTFLNDENFWEWLKEKERKEKGSQESEQIPLYISIDLPKPAKEEVSNESFDYESDIMDGSVIFQF